MALADEKQMVRRLRSEEGLTLQAIANRLGKSIYWVNARLNSDYEPQRERLTASGESQPQVEQLTEQPELAAEILKIYEMRQQGMTYEKIAANLNRSVYWVHTRLRENYRPSKIRTERVFQEVRVVPYLLQTGHVLVEQCLRVGEVPFEQEADVVTRLAGRLCITEVKLGVIHHELQTAIGQLMIHRFALSSSDPPKLQLALPVEAIDSRFNENFTRYLAETLQVALVLVP
jgi:hypothetical protein